MLRPHEVLASLYRHAQGGLLVSVQEISGGATIRITTADDRTATIVALAVENDLSDAGAIEAWICTYGCRTCGG